MSEATDLASPFTGYRYALKLTAMEMASETSTDHTEAHHTCKDNCVNVHSIHQILHLRYRGIDIIAVFIVCSTCLPVCPTYVACKASAAATVLPMISTVLFCHISSSLDLDGSSCERSPREEHGP